MIWDDFEYRRNFHQVKTLNAGEARLMLHRRAARLLPVAAAAFI